MRFNLLVVFASGYIGLGYALKRIEKLCPYNNFCKTNATKEINDKNLDPCCIQCFCDDACKKLGNCCPDKDNEDPNDASLQTCKETIIRRGSQQDLQVGKTYQVIDRCPSTETNTDIADMCTASELTDLTVRLWVSDTTTGQIFQNKYCAGCHGIKHYTYWQVITTCTTSLNETLFSQNENCLIMLVDPNDMELGTRLYECFKPDITRCNETGLWSHFNEETFNACSSINMPLIIEYANGDVNVIYKNVYCFLCNVRPNTKPPNSCTSRSIRGGMVPFSHILDFNKYFKRETNEFNNKCHLDEIYDRYLEICHRLHCPAFDQAAVRGQCEKKISVPLHASIRVAYKMKVLSTTIPAMGNFNSNLRNILGSDGFKEMTKALDFEGNDCLVHHQFLYDTEYFANDSLTHFIMFNDVCTTHQCDLHFLQEKMTNIVGNEITIFSDDHRRTVLQFYSIYADAFDSRNYSAFGQSVVRPNDCSPVYHLLSDKLCPQVHLNRTHIQSLSSSKSKSAMLTLFGKSNLEHGNSTIVMCLPDYFSYLSRSNAAKHTSYPLASKVTFVTKMLGLIFFFQLN